MTEVNKDDRDDEEFIIPDEALVVSKKDKEDIGLEFPDEAPAVPMPEDPVKYISGKPKVPPPSTKSGQEPIPGDVLVKAKESVKEYGDGMGGIKG